jgi:amino acid adenylation domain-containing protein
MILLRIAPGIDEMVQQWVTRNPEGIAIHDPSTNRALTYAQLWERSSWMAGDLARHGVRKNDVVAVSLNRSVELVVALLGIVRAGAVYLPLDVRAPRPRNAAIMAEAGAKLVIGSAGQITALGSDFPSVTPVAVPSGVPRDHVAPPDAPSAGDDPCYVMYTSGSTGAPKGVVVPHRAVVRLVTRPHYCLIAPGQRCANGSNPAFDATTFEIWGALAAGATVVVFPSVLELTIDDWVAMVRRERIDTMFLTTSLFHTVAREQPTAFGSLSNLVVGGEQLEISAVRRVLDAGPPRRLVNGYGPTETTTFAAYFDCTTCSLAGLDRIPVGYPLQDTSLHVLDDQMRQVPPGETGELCIGGPGVALGYLGRPDLTAERFVIEPAGGTRVYRTGDLARQLPSGAIEVLGRRDRQVKLRGFRIELEEVERAALGIGLCDAVVVEKVGEGPTALLVGFALPSASAGAGDLGARLSTALAARLPDYMVPAQWVVLDELPFGPTGKLDRARLVRDFTRPGAPAAASAAQNAAGSTAATPAATPTVPPADLSGSLAGELRDIWQAVLEVPPAAADSFIDLGGNSVMAVQVATRITQRLGVRVEPADVLLAESLADFARRLAAARGGDTVTL